MNNTQKTDIKWLVSTALCLLGIVFSSYLSTQWAMGEHSAKIVAVDARLTSHLIDKETHIDRATAIALERRLGTIEWSILNIEKAITNLSEEKHVRNN